MQPLTLGSRPQGPTIPTTPTDRVLPSPRTLVSWLFAARLAWAVGVLLWAALLWAETPDRSFAVSAVVLLAFTITAYGSWVVLVQGASPRRSFLALQGMVDIGLVALLVHFGGPASVFPALYVVVIAAYTLLLPFVPALLLTLLVVAVHITDALVLQPGPPSFGLWGQVAVFLLVFGVVALLAARLRQATVEQASLESALRRARLEADDILRNINSGVLTIDGRGRLAFLNPMGAALLGFGPELTRGMPVLDLVKPRCSELWAALTAGIRTGRRVKRGEGTIFDADRVLEIGLSTTVFEADPGEPPSVTALFTDISESRQLAELQMRAERLEAVANLSASLAHEIKNPLASIRSSVEQLARSARDDEDEQVLAGLIVRESDRLSRILTEFLDFARVRADEFAPVDLLAVSQASARLARAHPDCGAETEVRVEGDPATMEGDEDLLHRIVGNLVLNAVQAADGPTRVLVRAEPVPPDELPNAPGFESSVRLLVRDDGPGIPDEVRERLFQPFVTGRVGGTGLGLAVVQRAVDAHRGLILVDSSPDAGTVFTVYFPAKRSLERV